MGKIRMRSTAFSDNPELKAPVFNFSRYVADGEHTYYNNGEQIDFVTDGNSLYVCLSHDGVTPTYENIEDQADFLKLVSQGPQGIRGPRGYDGDSAETPRLSAEFDNDQLRVYINGEVETVSPRLTGKSWRPKLEDNMLVWELSNKMYAPEPIDLEDLRPIQEKPLLLRVDSDNTKRTDEKSGPARFIQWKYEGDPHWTNLISISELMNLTLAGITIFPVENTETGKTEYHLGHKEVLEATYDSDKDGHRIISNVELGHVLFDAGPIPIGEGSNGDDNDFQTQIDLILADLARLDTSAVKSVTINGNKKTPDPSGDVSFNIPTGATENWVANNYQPKGNYVKKILLNGSPYEPNSATGEVNLGNIGSGSGNDGVGVDNIEFRLSGNSLEYHVSINGTWQPNWTTIPLPSGSTGGGEHIELSIEDGALYISRNDGAPEYVGPVGNASGNWVKNITKNGNVLTITYWDNTSSDITLPSGGSGSTVSIRQELLNGTRIATITVDGVAYDIFAPAGSYNPDDPSNPGGNGEDGIVLDLTNEVNTIPVDKDKKTLSTASFLTELHAYSGSRTEIGFDQNDVTVAISPNITGISVVKNIDDNPKKFQININSGITVNEDVKIAFTLWANDSSRVARTAVYTLVPLRLSQSEMFYLELDPDIIKVDSEGNYTSETVSALPHWLLDGDPQSLVGWNDSSKINDASVKYHVYYKIDNGNYTFYTSPVDITSASDQAVFELRYYYNNNKTDYVVMDGPEHVLILRDGQRGPDGIRIINHNRYYKASNQSTGITAPNENLDPTLPENGGWLTTSNSMQLDEDHPYLWFFERFEYSDGSKWQSSPVIIRYFNAAAQADYEEIERNVLEAIDDDLDALDERLSTIVDTNGEVITDPDRGIIKALTSYEGEDHVSFADMILNAEEATVKTWAGSAFETGTGRTLTGVKNELDGIQGRIETAATQAKNSAVNDARTEWSAADASITSTATKAQYVWMASDGSLLEYTADDATNNRTTKSSGGKTYTRTLVSEAMSAIKQTADKVSILVGTNGNVNADVIVDAINGGTVTIDANHINLNGETIANAIMADSVEIKKNGNNTVILSEDGINVLAGTLGGGNGVSVTSSGVTLGSDCTISWNSVSNKPTIPSDLSQLTDSNNVITTTIGNTYVKTNDLFVNGKINANLIDANSVTAGSINTSTGSNGVSTKIQEGVFEISGCGNAKIAFGVDGNCVPYMYLTDANGNEIWRATNQGFNFSGTIVPQMIAAYPGNGHLLKSITISSGKISPYSFTYQNSGTSYEYDKTSSFSQYYVIRPGFVIKGSSYTRPDVKDGGGIATGGMIIGYFQPNYYSTKLVDFDQVNVTTNVPLDSFIYKGASNMCNPSSSNAIYNGYYISSPQLALIEDGVNNYIYGEGHGSLNIRFYLPIIHITNGHIDSVENVYYYPNEEAYHQFDGETVDLTDEDPWW